MFVAMNRISVRDDYKDRFEELFQTRAREVDREQGFLDARILRPLTQQQPYIVMTTWESKEHFDHWVESGAYRKGHSRGFEDMKKAREEGRPMPMSSDMELYEVFAD